MNVVKQELVLIYETLGRAQAVVKFAGTRDSSYPAEQAIERLKEIFAEYEAKLVELEK